MPINPTDLSQPGFYADIVGMRAAEVDSPATYELPELEPRGIEFVYRNGEHASLHPSQLSN